MHAATELAAGVSSLPGVGSAFAATQGAWRFLNNGRVTLAALIEPLRAIGQSRCQATQCKFVMLVYDWSKLSYHHARKRDLTLLTHETDVGYELTTALLVSADDGRPLAPMEFHLRTAKGMLSTRGPAPPVQPHLEQVLRLLVRLSGRQMKRHKPYIRPALLCGIWTLLAMLATLEQFNLQEIRRLAAAIPYLNSA